MDIGLRQIAAITFKNLVRKDWDPSGERAAPTAALREHHWHDGRFVMHCGEVHSCLSPAAVMCMLKGKVSIITDNNLVHCLKDRNRRGCHSNLGVDCLRQPCLAPYILAPLSHIPVGLIVTRTGQPDTRGRQGGGARARAGEHGARARRGAHAAGRVPEGDREHGLPRALARAAAIAAAQPRVAGALHALENPTEPRPERQHGLLPALQHQRARGAPGHPAPAHQPWKCL